MSAESILKNAAPNLLAPVEEKKSFPSFAGLPVRRAPWRAYGAGLAIQLVLLAVVVAWGLRTVRQKFWERRETTQLLFPPQPQPVRIRAIRVTPRHILHLLRLPHPPARVQKPRQLLIHLHLPDPVRPHMKSPVILPKMRQPKLARLVRPVQFQAPQMLAAVHRNESIATGVFHAAPSPRDPLPERKVQTGGFGAVTGVARQRFARHGNLEAVGTFDLPVGPGQGNGTGGTHGRRGVLAASGFGNGLRGPAHSAGGKVNAVGFGNDETGARSPAVRRAATPAPTRPVEIIFKPRPRYTPQARQKKIQGSVWLAVIFLASGRVRVLRVTQSLGAGLDAAARQAAAAIRFRPARRQGRAVDFPARIRIRFRLAH